MLASWAASGLGSEPAKQPVTGRLSVSFNERSPLTELTELCRRLDIDLQSASLAPSLKATANQYDLSREKMELFVPTGYKADVPHGLFVWAGVGPLPQGWFEIFSRYKLIAIAAIPSNAAVGFSRMRLPLDAVHNLKLRYTVDSNRVYIAGFSAGAGAAVHLICGFPELFRGGSFLMGGRFCLARKTEQNQYEPTLELLSPKWKAPLEQVTREQRLVFLRAQGDSLYSPQEDVAQYYSLMLDNFQNVAFVVAPGGHRTPDAFWFEQVIKALEVPRSRVATTQPMPLPTLGPAGQAQRLLATAQLMLERKPPTNLDKAARERVQATSHARASQYLREVLDKYPTTPAAEKARQVLARIPGN